MDCGAKVVLILWHDHQSECQGGTSTRASTSVTNDKNPIWASISVAHGKHPTGDSTTAYFHKNVSTKPSTSVFDEQPSITSAQVSFVDSMN